MPRHHIPRAEQCRDALPLLDESSEYQAAARFALQRRKIGLARAHLDTASEKLAQARTALGK